MYDSEGDSIDSSSDESPSSEEAKRKLFMYQEMLDKKLAEGTPDSTRKRKAVDPLNDNYNCQMLLNCSINIIRNSFERAMHEAKMLGYVYGIILEDDSVLTGSSPSLSEWWEEVVKFEHNGTAAANKFYMENQLNFVANNDIETPRKTYDLLMVLSGATLGSILSAVMNCCDPPQRKFPLEKNVPPPWWPTGNEPWWDQIPIEKEHGLPPYKKPHDLRKMWKTVVVIAIIKHVAPAFDKLAREVKQSKNLQERISVREMYAWNRILKEEAKMYTREHPDVSLSGLLLLFQNQVPVLSDNRNSSSSQEHVEGSQLQLQLLPQEQEPSLLLMQQQHQVAPIVCPPMEESVLRYTCNYTRCLHQNSKFGFRTKELRDQHQHSCGFRNLVGNLGRQVEPPAFPMSTLYQEMVPPQFTAMPQAPRFTTQQMAPPPFRPMEFQPPATAYQEFVGSFPEVGPLQQAWSSNNTGVPNYMATPKDGQAMGPLRSAISGYGFFHGDGRYGNAEGYFM